MSISFCLDHITLNKRLPYSLYGLLLFLSAFLVLIHFLITSYVLYKVFPEKIKYALPPVQSVEDSYTKIE